MSKLCTQRQVLHSLLMKPFQKNTYIKMDLFLCLFSAKFNITVTQSHFLLDNIWKWAKEQDSRRESEKYERDECEYFLFSLFFHDTEQRISEFSVAGLKKDLIWRCQLLLWANFYFLIFYRPKWLKCYQKSNQQIKQSLNKSVVAPGDSEQDLAWLTTQITFIQSLNYTSFQLLYSWTLCAHISSLI